MDTTDPQIVFDEQGVCTHCHRYDTQISARIIPKEKKEAAMKSLADKIKKGGKNRKFDCIIGVSGGVDSTYVAYLVKGLGLRPLAVHFDNGWNSELAVSNIEKFLTKLGIELYTHVVNWDEFRDLQVSFLKASTPDAEIPTDHGIVALLFQIASKFNIRYVINGHNYSTEATLPVNWGYGYYDSTYLRSVHKKYGTVPLRTTPIMSLLDLFYYTQIKRIKLVSILNYIDYRKSEAMEILQNELGWVYYGGKHYESIYTRFFQAYILPRKFNIDKRKAHLSSLINSKQITREKALQEMKLEIAPERMMKEDREYVIKKLSLTEAAFEEIMKAPRKTFLEYKNEYHLMEKAKRFKKYLHFN